MREGGVVVAVAGVAVVPDGDQAQVGHGGEHRGPGADRGTDGPPPDREPLPVPLLGTGVGGEQRVVPLAEQSGERRVHPSRRPAVRYHDERAPARCQGRGDGPGDLLGPVRSGQRGPHRPGRTTLGQRPQEAGPLGVPLPGPGRGGGRRRQGRRGASGLGAAVPRGYGELKHVGEAARVPVGDGTAEGEQLRSEHRLRRDDVREGRESALVVRGGTPLDEEAVDESAALAAAAAHLPPAGAEPHPDPDAGPRVGVELLGDGVVEVLVEVERALVHQDAGDGKLPGERGAAPGPGFGPRHLGPAHGLPDERELLRCPGIGLLGPLVVAAHGNLPTRPD